MSSLKNIITWSVKIAIGLGSFLLIYWRLMSDLNPEKINFLVSSLTSFTAYFFLFFCILLVPVNWGIESYKWQQITLPVEVLSLSKAMKSVYSGICVGNFAPGRATEFLAKILFFRPENRPTVTLLHFANGMFQLAITILVGLFSLLYKVQQTIEVNPTIISFIISFSLLLLAMFFIFVFRFDIIQNWIISRFKKPETSAFAYSFTKPLTAKLLLLSILRYCVFTFQFILVLKLFYSGQVTTNLIASISIYFLLTTILPMISFIEAAIRAAIAIIVFNSFDIAEASLVITAVLIWLMNIVLPSIAGYIVIVNEKFEFRLLKK